MLSQVFLGVNSWSKAGTGVIWSAVIPAKAGIHAPTMALPLCTSPSGLELLGANESNLPLDSRFRGNDQRFQRDPIPNDTTTSNAESDVPPLRV
jgi:hypothetical protein